MSYNPSSLFNGNFLIHGGYALSFVPGLIKNMQPGAAELSTERMDKIEHKVQSKVDAPSGADHAKSVIVLNIKQPIVKFSDYWNGWLGSKTFMKILDSYMGDPNIAGVVLDIDSGGGQVYGTPEFYDYIKDYPKPVVTYTDGYLCSGAYYIGNASRWIVANKRADHIGSLGAKAYYVDFTGLYEKYGAKVFSMYGTKSTRKNFEIRQLEEKGDTSPYILNVLDPIVEVFHDDMRATRPGLHEDVFTGDTWPATKALDMGLVDELGTLHTAVLKVYELDNQSSNQNSNNMSKPRANVQAVLGLTAPLASTDKGSYLNDEQLDTIDQKFAEEEAAKADLQGKFDTATAAQTKAEGDLTAAQQAHTDANTALEGKVDTMIAAAGITATGTLTEKLDALNNHYAAANKGDGAKPTNVHADGKPSADTPSYLDTKASHNQIANELFQ